MFKRRDHFGRFLPNDLLEVEEDIELELEFEDTPFFQDLFLGDLYPKNPFVYAHEQFPTPTSSKGSLNLNDTFAALVYQNNPLAIVLYQNINNPPPLRIVQLTFPFPIPIL